MPKQPGSQLRKILADNLRALRKAKGLSQEGLADLCELHRTYIGSVERTERNATLSTLDALAKGLGVSVPELLTAGNSNDDGKIQDGDTGCGNKHLRPGGDR